MGKNKEIYQVSVHPDFRVFFTCHEEEGGSVSRPFRNRCVEVNFNFIKASIDGMKYHRNHILLSNHFPPFAKFDGDVNSIKEINQSVVRFKTGLKIYTIDL